MAEEVTIFVRPNENYTYKTPFQTINIIQMSEDEQDDPDPITPGTDPEPLLIAYSTNGTDFINFNKTNWKPSNNTTHSGLIINDIGLTITNSNWDCRYYYEGIPTSNYLYIKTKHNTILEITMEELRNLTFNHFNLKSIITCTNEIEETIESNTDFDKLNMIDSPNNLINYTEWSTEGFEIETERMNICYNPDTDELYIGKQLYIPETTPAYFYNSQDNASEAVFLQNYSFIPSVTFRGKLTKITGASTIFNMTHD